MSELKVTKGEWRVDYSTYSTGLGVVSDKGGREIHWTLITPETEANAHLIAASPDMYAMLEELSKDQEYHWAKDINDLLTKARGETK